MGTPPKGSRDDNEAAERERMERELRESERRLATLLSNLPGIAYRCRNDEHWTMEFISDGCRDLTGYAPADLLGNRVKSYAQVIHPEDRAPVAVGVREALAGGRPFELAYRIVTASGETRWVWEKGRGVPDPAGGPAALEGFITDVSARVRAEDAARLLQAQMQQAQKLESIGRLAGGVAHDFNNLLTAILGNISMAMMKVPPGSPVARSLGEASHAADSATALTRKLLAFSRKQAIEPEVFDLNELVEGIRKILARMIGEDIELTSSPSPGICLIRADRSQVEQIILNLGVNARDAMPAGGRLILQTGVVVLDSEYCETHAGVEPGRYAMLGVADTGVGMSEEVKKHLFEPFFTTKEHGKGTGLGLAMVYGAVAQNRGSIQVYSEVGKGTMIKAYFPCVQAEGGCPPDKKPGHERIPEGEETVLLVEDDELVRKYAAEVLAMLGYEVIVATRGSEALAAARRHPGPIHLLLTDMVMPGMDGMAVAEVLGGERPELRVLFMSGYTGEVVARQGFLEGTTPFLGKPFIPSDLAKKVREVLDGKAGG